MLGYVSLWAATVAPLVLRHKCMVVRKGKEKGMAAAGLFDIMYSTRSMRKLKTDPIPDEVLYQILEAGTRAPSGTNTQHWRFIVVKDPAVKKQVQAIYQKGWGEARAMYDNRPGPEHIPAEKFHRLLNAATHLAEHLAEYRLHHRGGGDDRSLPQHQHHLCRLGAAIADPRPAPWWRRPP